MFVFVFVANFVTSANEFLNVRKVVASFRVLESANWLASLLAEPLVCLSLVFKLKLPIGKDTSKGRGRGKGDDDVTKISRLEANFIGQKWFKQSDDDDASARRAATIKLCLVSRCLSSL